MVRLKALRFSMTKKEIHSMPLYATKSLKMLTKLRLTLTNIISMENNSMLTTMKSKSLEKSKMKMSEIRLISKTIRNKQLDYPWTSLISQKF